MDKETAGFGPPFSFVPLPLRVWLDPRVKPEDDEREVCRFTGNGAACCMA